MSDSGSTIRYQLYKNSDGTYNYVRKEYDITIAGENEISSKKGKIKSKMDLLNIDNKEAPDKKNMDIIYCCNYTNSFLHKTLIIATPY